MNISQIKYVLNHFTNYINESVKNDAIQLANEVDSNCLVVVEELSELIKATTKCERSYSEEHKLELLEKIADVRISIDRLIKKYEICESDIYKIINYKHKRLFERYGKDIEED